MTVLNASGHDVEEIPFVNMLKHWLSQYTIREMVAQKKLIVITSEDHLALARNTMTKHRAAFIIRRMLFDKSVLRACAKVVQSRYAISYPEAHKQLETIRFELKDLAHVSAAGLVLPSDPRHIPGPRVQKPTDLEKRIERTAEKRGAFIEGKLQQAGAFAPREAGTNLAQDIARGIVKRP